MNSVDKRKHFRTNFVERRPAVPGGCPLLNTAIDADDGNPVLRERSQALREWRDFLSSILNAGVERKEIRGGVDARRLATLIISSLEGALMISRLERDREALMATRSYLERYLETEVRIGK
jgi:TetR/AcrR family transcriptional repressor of nem operon